MTHKNTPSATYLSVLEIQSIFDRVSSQFRGSSTLTANIPIILGPMPQRIEHTLLKMDATPAHLTQLCQDAITHRFRGICCLARHIGHCRQLVQPHEIIVVSVIDFPLCGATARDAAALAKSAVDDGANEVDMVIDVPSLKAGLLESVFERIALVVEAAQGAPVKVILETAYLTEPEIVTACALSSIAGAAFVKTSTGFAHRGASLRDIALMKSAVGERMRIKASGGIKDATFARQLVAAGADVIGTSAGPACVLPV